MTDTPKCLMEIDSMVIHLLTKDAEIMEVNTDHQLRQKDWTEDIPTIALPHHPLIVVPTICMQMTETQTSGDQIHQEVKERKIRDWINL